MIMMFLRFAVSTVLTSIFIASFVYFTPYIKYPNYQGLITAALIVAALSTLITIMCNRIIKGPWVKRALVLVGVSTVASDVVNNMSGFSMEPNLDTLFFFGFLCMCSVFIVDSILRR